MNRTRWMFILGLIGASLVTIWVILHRSEPPKQQPPVDLLRLNPTQPKAPDRKQKQGQATIFHTLAAMILFLTPFILIIFWGSGFLTNLAALPDQPNGFDQAHAVPSSFDQTTISGGLSTFVGTSEHPSPVHATLLLIINQIKSTSVTQAMLLGALNLYIPSDLLARICDVSLHATSTADRTTCKVGGSPIATQTNYGNLQLKPQYVQKSLILWVGNISGYPDFSQAIPLQQFFPFGERIHIPLALTISGLGSAYPNDWYESIVLVNLQLPNLFYVGDFPKGGINLPLDARVAPSSTMLGMTVLLAPGTNSFFESHSLELHTLIQRSLPSVIPVYFTATVIPFAFLILFWYTLFILDKNTEEPLHNISLNTLIVALTVVAVRQVLVPSDLQGILTRLDFLLITEGMFLLGLVFWKGAQQIWLYSRKTKITQKH